MRAMTSSADSVRGSARISSTVRSGRRVAVRDRVGGGGVGDEGDLVAEVGARPGRWSRSTARCGCRRRSARATPRSVSSCCRFVVVNALCEVLVITGSPPARLEPVHQPDVARWPGRRRRRCPGSACRTQTTRSPRPRAASTSRSTWSAIVGVGDGRATVGRARKDSWTSMTMSARVSCLDPGAAGAGARQARSGPGCGPIRSPGERTGAVPETCPCGLPSPYDRLLRAVPPRV